MADKLVLTTFGSLQNDTSATTDLNNNSAAIITAVNNTLSRDGTSPNQMGSDLDMNSNRIINLPLPISQFEPLRLVDATTVGGVTVNPLPVGGTTGQSLVKNSNTNFDTKWSSSGSNSFSTAIFSGSSSGSTTVQAQSVASGTLNLPAANDTLVGRTTTDTLTNKTFDTAGAGNSLLIAGTPITAVSGSGSVLLSSSPSFTTPNLGAATATSINKVALTAPATGSTLTIADGKTLTVNNSLSLSGTDATTLTFQGTDTYVGRATTDSLTNKTFDTGGTGNSFLINGNAITSNTGTGAVNVLATSPTLVTPILGVAAATTINKVTITAPATSATLTIPNASVVTMQGTDTYVGRATTDTFTNKTYDTAGTGNVFKINGTAISANTGTGSNVLATTPTLVTPVLGAATGTSVSLTGAATIFSGTAVPSGGTADTALLMSSTAHLGIYFGTGTPTVSAAQGSLYINVAGSSTSTRMYINTNGTTGWTAVTTAA